MMARIVGSALVAGLLILPPATSAADEPAPVHPKTNISGPDRADSAFARTASDGDRVVTAWHDHQFGGSAAEIAVAVSDDGGSTWRRPTNVSRSPAMDSSRASVAVDGDTIWVSWHEGTPADSPSVGNHDIRAARSSDGGLTWAVPVVVHQDRADSLFPQVAVHSGRPYVSWAGLDSRRYLGYSRDEGASWTVELLDDRAESQSTATAMISTDGQLYVAWGGPAQTESAPGGVSMVQVGPTHTVGTVREIEPPGAIVHGVTVDAQAGTVALGWTQTASPSAPRVAHVAVSRDEGETFIEARALTTPADPTVLEDVLVHGGSVTAAFVRQTTGRQVTRTSRDGGRSWTADVVLPAGGAGQLIAARSERRSEPSVHWDYSVPERFGPDKDDDHVIDYRTDPAWIAAATLPVDIDACASFGGSAPIDRFIVKVAGSTFTSSRCEIRVQVPGEGTYPVRVEVHNADGDVGFAVHTIDVVDHLIFSMGDSVASGEGVPDYEIGGEWERAVWVDRRCHRSANAGPAEAALKLEREDPRSSVTFVSLACSGAAIMGPDVSSGGLLTPYEGLEPESPALMAQVDRAKAMLGSRELDALLLSIGANDVKFSHVVEGCIKEDCTVGGYAGDFGERLGRLPTRYAQLATALEPMASPAQVFITDYFDPLRDRAGTLNMDCALDGYATGVTRAEAAWAYENVMVPLNATVHLAANKHQWNLVGGMMDAFAQHGYCSTDSWVVQLGQSRIQQGDVNGAFHPNRRGHDIYGTALARAVRPMLPAPAPAPAPGDEQDPTTPATDVGAVHLVYVADRQVFAVPVDVTGASDPGVPVNFSHQPESRQAGDARVVSTTTGLVATWMEQADEEPDTGGFEIMSSRLGTAPPDLQLERVTAVQASARAGLAVAGKQAVAAVEVYSTFDTSRRVVVEVSSGSQQVRQTVAIEPGRHTVHLTDPAFVPSGDTFSMRALLDPTAQLDEASETNNSASTPKLPVMEARPVRLLFVAVEGAGEEPTPCPVVTQVAQQAGDYLRDVLPLRPQDLVIESSCSARLVAPDGNTGPTGLLMQAGGMASAHGFDQVLGVTRPGYLNDAFGGNGTTGLALLGESADDGAVGSAALLDPVTTPYGATAAHEVGHSFGLEHRADVPAPGVRLSTMQVKRGVDVMAPTTSHDQWISGATWDRLLRRLSGTRPVDLAAAVVDGALAVSVNRAPDGTITAPAWQRLEVTADQPLGQSGTLTLRYLDPSGEELARTGLPDLAVERLTGVSTESAGAGLGTQTQALVPWVAGTARLVVSEGEKTLFERAVTEAPEVTFTDDGPSSVEVGDVVTLTWSGSDPDSDPLTYAVDVTRNGGTAWLPVRSDLSESLLELHVDKHLAGATLAFRIRASDGVQTTVATGDTVAVGAPVTEGKIAYTLSDSRLDWANPRRDIAVTNADGTGHEVLTSTGIDRDPSWSPDGSRIVYRHGNALWTMSADGSGAEELLPPRDINGIPAGLSCPAWSPDGTRIAFLAANALEVVDAEGGGRRRLVGLGSNEALLPLDCPSWSPGSDRVALVGRTSGQVDDAVWLIDMTSGGHTLVPGTRTSWTSVDWSADDLLLLEPTSMSGAVVFTTSGQLVSRVSTHYGGDPGNWRAGTFSPAGHRAVGVIDTFNSSGYSGMEELQLRALDGSGALQVTRLRELYERGVDASDPDWQALGQAPKPPAPSPDLAQLDTAYDAVEGRPLHLDATGGLRPGGEVPSYAWDLDGDGAYDDAGGATTTKTWNDDGAFEIGLRAELADGTTDTATAVVSVTNRVPELRSAAIEAVPAHPVTLDATRIVDASGDTLEAWVDWGDGSGPTQAEVVSDRPGEWRLPESHTYGVVGDYVATVEVKDDDNGEATLEVPVTVGHYPPTVAAISPTAGPATGGAKVTITGRLLNGATQVLFGDTAAADFEVVSDHKVVATAPALQPGSEVPVVVRSASGASLTVAAAVWTAENAAPLIVVDDPSIQTALDVPVSVEMSGSDAEERPLTFKVALPAAHGTVDVVGDVATYTPHPAWWGTDSFSVVADDGTDASVPVQVRVSVGSRPPVAYGETREVANRHAEVELSTLLANDVDPDDQTLQLVAAEATDGSFVRLAEDAVVIDMTADASSAAFRYTIEDPTGMQSTATSWVRLAAADGVLDAGPDLAGDEGSAIALTGLAPEGAMTTWTVDAEMCSIAQPKSVATTITCPDDVVAQVTLAMEGSPRRTDTAHIAVQNLAPQVSVVAPIDGSRVTVGDAVELDVVITDAGSRDQLDCSVDWGDDQGVASCAALHTFETVGPHRVVVTVTDDDGGSSATEIDLHAVWPFAGFRPPVDNPSTLNLVKAGSTVPVKFSLGGNRGLAIFQTGSPSSSSVSCGGGLSDAVEQTSNARASQLHYDALTDQYIYDWKTSATWIKTCRRLVLHFTDGTVRTAEFKFR